VSIQHHFRIFPVDYTGFITRPIYGKKQNEESQTIVLLKFKLLTKAEVTTISKMLQDTSTKNCNGYSTDFLTLLNDIFLTCDGCQLVLANSIHYVGRKPEAMYLSFYIR
jgi:hypothetical protein